MITNEIKEIDNELSQNNSSSTRSVRCRVLGVFRFACGGGAAVAPRNQIRAYLPVFPAKGMVTFKGKAPEGASVALHPKDPELAKNQKFIPPRASVQPDGTFALTSYQSNDGAVPGEYVLTITWHKTIKRLQRRTGPGAQPVAGAVQQSKNLAGDRQNRGGQKRPAPHRVEIAF